MFIDAIRSEGSTKGAARWIPRGGIRVTSETVSDWQEDAERVHPPTRATKQVGEPVSDGVGVGVDWTCCTVPTRLESACNECAGTMSSVISAQSRRARAISGSLSGT